MIKGIDYSVRVKNGSGWRQYERLRLMISVGQEYHEGQKLLAVVNWINRNPNVKAVHISVNDFLQRHNLYAQGIDIERADSIALAQGMLWIERNEDILSGIKVPIKITRWKDWFGTTKYIAVRSFIEKYVKKDNEFREAIETDANSLAVRKAKRGEYVSSSLVAHSREYLKEELALFAIQTQEMPAADVYPGKMLGSAEYLLNRSLPELIAPLAKRYFTRIDFARVNSAQADLGLIQSLVMDGSGTG